MPAGLDWDQFLGPAQCKPYSKNKFAYNWHWFWDTGNGDIGNQGVHEMDIALWGLGRAGWPETVTSARRQVRLEGRPGDAQHAADHAYNFGDAQMTFDVRNLPTPPEGLGGMRGPITLATFSMGTPAF